MPDPQYLHPEHPRTGTALVLHLAPGHLVQLNDFLVGMSRQGRDAIAAGGLSILVELIPSDLQDTMVAGEVKLKPGLMTAATWTPKLITVPGQVMPLYFPEPTPPATVIQENVHA